MKYLFLPLLILLLCFNSCKTPVRKKAPVPKSDTDLITGCYYIVSDSTKLKREVVHSPDHESYFIDPKPILTVANFKEVSVEETQGIPVLNVNLDETGKAEWSLATEKCAGKKLAFVINNTLVMSPTVLSKISGGKFEISGNFKEEELKGFLKDIEHDMYE